jgi:hypothetical protein
VKLLVSASPGEARVAAVDAAGLVDYAIWRPGAPDGVGDLHRGRVTAIVPAMAGAFVAIGGADGFLPDSEGAKGLSEGSIIAVRVTRAPQGGKGPRLTAKIPAADAALAGTGAPALLRRGPGAIERLAACHAGVPVLVDDPALLALLRPLLGGRLSLVAHAFDDDVETAVAELGTPRATLPGGAVMQVAPTPALTAIDIDLAGGTAARAPKGRAQSEANRALLPGLARQIRLRNLGGAIVVDLGGMPATKRVSLAPDFAAALEGDPLRPRFLGFTALGLAEILRPRVHPPLHETLAGPLAAGLAALREAANEVAASPARALALRAAPAVVAALEGDPGALNDFTRRAGRTLTLRADRALPGLAWMLEDAP